MTRSGIGIACAMALLVAACVSVTPQASPTQEATSSRAAAPSATPSPEPTQAPTAAHTPSPSPAPATPSATPQAPLSADEIVSRLVAFSTSEVPFALLMNGTADGSIGGTETSIEVGYAGDARGDDFAGTVTFSQPGVNISADAVIIGDQAWTRPGGEGEWQMTSYDPTQPFQPIRNITAGDVTYVGVALDAGRPIHTLTIDHWTGADFRQLGFRRPRLTINRYELTVNNDGYPEVVDLEYELRGRLAGELFDVTYTLLYEMSDFEKEVTIEPPI